MGRQEETLREYIETKLILNGFALDEVEDGIKAWDRNLAPEQATYILVEESGVYKVKSGIGRFSTKKNQQFMNMYLATWSREYKEGAR